MLSRFGGYVSSLLWSACCAICVFMGYVSGTSLQPELEAKLASETYNTGYESGYKDGYAVGYSAGASDKATRAYNDGLLEGARQILELYAAEGDAALRPQIRLLRGEAPQGGKLKR